MKVNIITIGKTNHAKWGVGSDEHKVAGRLVLNYFLESEDKKVLQKIKLGGAAKQFPDDAEFSPANVVIGDVVTGENGISIQDIELPFGSVFINSKNLNPYLAGLNTDSRDRIVILLIGTDYSYIRSNVNHDVGEIICTFHTPNAIACIMRVYEDALDSIKNQEKPAKETSLIMVDTVKDGEFVHFRMNVVTETGGLKAVQSTIKKPDLIKRLTGIDQKFKIKKTARRFVRYTPSIITSFFVSPITMSDEEIGELVNHHPISDALGENIPFTSYQVTVGEDGSIINDENLENVVNSMIENKVKAFTLVGCRALKNQFEPVKPLYIFSMDGTEDVTKDEVAMIKCIKSN